MKNRCTVILLLAVGLLCAIGVAFIYSSGYISAQLPTRGNWLRQIAFLMLGMTSCVGISRLRTGSKTWRMAVFGGYALNIVLLVLVFIVGKNINGARRWIVIGSFLLQPAEFAKVFTLLTVATVLSGEVLKKCWQEALSAILLTALPCLLIGLEPSYGNAGSLLPGLCLMLGIRFFPPWLWKCTLAMIFGLIICGVTGLSYVRNMPQQGNVSKWKTRSVLRGYHLKRLNSYLSPNGDWNERQSVMTVAGGGLLGKGYLNGTMKKLGFLPRTVAPTDFIFAVIAEEGGFLLGVCPVLLLYAILFATLLHIAAHCQHRLGLNVIVAGCSLLLVHIIVGIGMAIRLIPVIGLPLPFLSYGGSFTLATFLMLGAMLGTRHRLNENIPADDAIHHLTFGKWLSFHTKIIP